MNNYEPVIGLEVHVETKSDVKMFCYCSTDYFGRDPNTHTCPVCLGLPGAVPIGNKKAVENCIKIGLALNCTISQYSLFERKNYFYPDLPKGYQISQYRWPLCTNGFLEVTDKNGTKKKIRINRVHQEEDTGKLMHIGSDTVIDFNRSGVPLVEIVTEPDFTDSEQVKNFAKQLQQIFRYLGVSEADMEKGQMRLEANVSVRPSGEKELPTYRVELKNINSFRFMASAIEYEIKRQIEVLEKGGKIKQHTRGWDEDKKQTYVQREKEEAHDYRYFPDPDLPKLKIETSEINKLKESIPELPMQKVERFVKDYAISEEQAEILTESLSTAEYFEETVKIGQKEKIEPKQIANFIVNQKVDISTTKPFDIVESIVEKKAGLITDEKTLEELVQKAILENPKAVADYKKGKITALQALLGAVMRYSQGKADSVKAKAILEQKLS